MDKKITKKELQQIKDCLETIVRSFAKRIMPVYKALDWKWGKNEPPNEDDIIFTLKRDLIDGLIEMSSKDLPTSKYLETGGLKAGYDYSDENCPEVSISFIDEYVVYPSKIKE